MVALAERCTVNIPHALSKILSLSVRGYNGIRRPVRFSFAPTRPRHMDLDAFGPPLRRRLCTRPIPRQKHTTQYVDIVSLDLLVLTECSDREIRCYSSKHAPLQVPMLSGKAILKTVIFRTADVTITIIHPQVSTRICARLD